MLLPSGIDPRRLTATGMHADDIETLVLMERQLRARQVRNLLRQSYRDGKKRLSNLGIAVPDDLAAEINAVVGWPDKAVNDTVRRLNLTGFAAPGEISTNADIAAIFDVNRMELAARQIHDETCTYGTSFVTVHKGDPSAGEPEVLISGYSALEATAEWNSRTGQIRHGLTIDERAESGRVNVMSMWLPIGVITLRRDLDSGRWDWEFASQAMSRPAMTVFSHQSSLNRRFGRSRITRAVMGFTDNAVRTLLRLEVNAEFFAAPQRYALDVDEAAFVDETTGKVRPAWESIVGRVLALSGVPVNPDDEESPLTRPQVGQFPQGTMQPHTEQLKTLAMMFSGETGIPLGRLGIVQDNPSSADAMRVGEGESIAIAEAAADEMSHPWADVALLAIQVRDDLPEPPASLAGLRPRWRDPATPTKYAEAQRAALLISQGVLQPDSEITHEQLGFDAVTIARLAEEKRRREAAANLTGIVAAVKGSGATTSGSDEAAALKAKAEAYATLVDAGVDPAAAAAAVGLPAMSHAAAAPPAPQPTIENPAVAGAPAREPAADQE